MAGSSTLPTERKSKKSSIEESPIFVVSTSGHLTEELQCSICLDVFTDPVTTPCGHNFCKSCLNECWDNSQDHKCPYCKEAYNQRPDLKINTTLREVVDHYKEKTGLTKFEVPCDACAGRKIKAMKSCLDCGLTFCKVHLEPHNTVAKYKKHKLIDPVENLENYICQKHERPLVLFCRDDQTCVCLFCTEGDHKTHNTVPIEEESKERQGKLAKTQTEVQQMIQDRSLKIQEIKNSVILSKVNAEKEKTDSFEVFTALIRSIERCQAELLEVMEEKQKAAEKQAEDLIKELQQEITELQRRDTELEQLSHTEDHLHLLQIYPSLCSPLNTKKRKEIRFKTHLNMDTLRRSVVQLQKTLDEKLSKIVLTEMQQFAVDVTLDPDTAHPELILSDDGKQVKHTDKKQNVPINPKRFDHCSCVLGREGFSSGRFYYEVQVKDKTDWDLGVACESIKRKGEIIIGPQNGFWTIYLRNGNVYKVPNNPSLPLFLKVKPQKVGVFVDYEEGLVSFYDVESSSHIYSFTGQSFTEKLYPYFSPDNNHGGKNSAPLIISPLCCKF